MILITDFFNITAKAIDAKYFPEVKYYRDNKDCADVHYTLELFSNGCLSYKDLIKRLSRSCKDSTENIHNIVKEFVADFEGYKFTNKFGSLV